ncbi:PDZ domain-containing protein [Fibrobacter intestinalis]|uniref:PDZ domain-containing protein n=1 Tax=Fibrobacter intestinalis TaxID=28122 RepID=A0A1M6U960_9BACT|nr:PDZ domain-containing protein [Fibrobacter intestinalis]SHK65724.1 PDZ domain-containing protein [Fibrobacter intestinalis]
MKKIFLTALTLCATTLFADESFGGIGLVVQDENIGLGIETIIPNTPAAKSKLKSGDLIIAADGKSFENLSFEQSVSLFRDVNNKPIVLTYIRDNDTLQATLRRTMITTKQVSSIDASDVEINGKKYISTFELGDDSYIAVFLDSSAPKFKDDNSKQKGKLSGLRLLQIQENIISYENTANGKTFSTDLNGKSRNK